MNAYQTSVLRVMLSLLLLSSWIGDPPLTHAATAVRQSSAPTESPPSPGSRVLVSPRAMRAIAVSINEVMASNSETIQDEDGDYSDWIELYNSTAITVDLTGYGLSDDLAVPFQWTFTNTQLAPGTFLLMFASGKDRRVVPPGSPNARLHTNFKISASGETLLLTQPDGQRADEVALGPSQPDISWGRQPDGGADWFLFPSPTPGTANTTPPQIPLPAFSHAGGFYTSALTLTLTAVYTDAIVRYTLDGSEPDESSPIYTSPLSITSRVGQPNDISMIRTNPPDSPGTWVWQPPQGDVFKATVVRARTFRPGYNPSPVGTQTYLVDPNAPARYSLPIFSLATDRGNFFDYERGIYVPGKIHDQDPSWYWPWGTGNYHQDGDAWERPLHIEFFEPAGRLGFALDGGVRIHGAGTAAYPEKSLRLYARGDYGSSSMVYPIFATPPITEFKRIILRNAGNDFISTMFRDAMQQSLMEGTGVGVQAYRPAIVFLNGEYWGIHNIRERMDKYYFPSHYGVDPDNIDLIEYESSSVVVSEGDAQHYDALMSFVRSNDLSLAANYDYIKTQMDVENFASYQAAEIYFANLDWPGNNVRLWRPRTPDGRWQWLLFDTDIGFSMYADNHAHNTLAFAAEPNGPDWPNPPWATLLFRSLLQNLEFRQLFITRLADYLNTRFQPEYVITRIDSMQAALAPEMPEHIARWNYPASMEQWNSNVQVLRDFAADRPAHVWTHLQEFFGLSQPVSVTLNVSNPDYGTLKINSVKLGANEFPWQGLYFPGVPIQITALPEPGFRWAGWVGHEGLTSTLTLTPREAISLTALFEVDYSLVTPSAFDLSQSPYTFTTWYSNAPAGTYPPHTLFQQTDIADPGLRAEMVSDWTLPYSLTSGSRINGLGTDGFAFINTGSVQPNGGGYLGAMILALNTLGQENVRVTWRGGTVTPNNRVQAIRLQYRIGVTDPFTDVLDSSDHPIEYVRVITPGHSLVLGPVALPSAVNNQPYIQLRWKYYYIETGVTGPRAQLRVGDIRVESTIRPTSVHISAPRAVAANKVYTFTATVSPLTTSPPITYTWQPEPFGGQGTPAASYLWSLTGTGSLWLPLIQPITVTVSNPVGTVTGTARVYVFYTEPRFIYLPLVTRDVGP